MKKIYIVEDNDAIRELLEIFLTSENYVVQSFASVSEFTSRDINIVPDLYLFDVMLPDGSGIDLCQKVKREKKEPLVPVIMMSAHASLGNMKSLYEPDDFITKPFDIFNVLERIQGIIN